MTSKAESIKGTLSGLVDPCFKGCNHHYETLLSIPWRVYCKKGCKGDADNWDDCVEECRETCYKDPIISGPGVLSNLSAAIDRSPGAPNQSMRCYKACLWGCAARFNAPLESYNAATGKQPYVENPAQFVTSAETVQSSTSLNGSQFASQERQVSEISSGKPGSLQSPVTEASA